MKNRVFRDSKMSMRVPIYWQKVGRPSKRGSRRLRARDRFLELSHALLELRVVRLLRQREPELEACLSQVADREQLVGTHGERARTRALHEGRELRSVFAAQRVRDVLRRQAHRELFREQPQV